MDYKEVEQLVEFFEERVLTEFDKHFNYLVLEDFYTGGYEERIEDGWFYKEYFEIYEQRIVNLLLEIGDEGEDFYEFQLRLIRLKRIIDNKLIQIGKPSTELKPIRQSRLIKFILNSDVSNKVIDLLYKELYHKNFIDCTLEEFQSIFLKEKETQTIQWKGTELQLSFLISELIENYNILDPSLVRKKFTLVQKFFVNKSGNEFKPKQMSSVYVDRKGLIPTDDPIRLTLQKVSAYKPLH